MTSIQASNALHSLCFRPGSRSWLNSFGIEVYYPTHTFAAISLRLAAIMALSPFDAPPPAAGAAAAFLLTAAAAAGFFGRAFSFAAAAAVVVTLFHPFASSRVSSSKFLSTFST